MPGSAPASLLHLADRVTARLDEFLAVRRRVDPNGVWASDQARRLHLL